jgi:two-component system cell cycle response regulator DivK
VKARILVVEDNLLNRQLVRDVLEYRGHVVLEASSVEDGRSFLRRGAPDLVLMDIHIPGGGGELLLREIRSDPLNSSLPVVALTAFAMHEDRERFLKAGFDGYLSKPIDVRTFGAEVESYLTRRAQGVQDVR